MLAGIFGQITPPDAVAKYNDIAGNANPGAGLFVFISNLLKLIAVVGGIYMIIQFILAGFAYISASGDPKKTEAAWTKIWQSILGLVIITSAFVIASIVERLTGLKIINPIIYGPF